MWINNIQTIQNVEPGSSYYPSDGAKYYGFSSDESVAPYNCFTYQFLCLRDGTINFNWYCSYSEYSVDRTYFLCDSDFEFDSNTGEPVTYLAKYEDSTTRAHTYNIVKNHTYFIVFKGKTDRSITSSGFHIYLSNCTYSVGNVKVINNAIGQYKFKTNGYRFRTEIYEIHVARPVTCLSFGSVNLYPEGTISVYLSNTLEEVDINTGLPTGTSLFTYEEGLDVISTDINSTTPLSNTDPYYLYVRYKDVGSTTFFLNLMIYGNGYTPYLHATNGSATFGSSEATYTTLSRAPLKFMYLQLYLKETYWWVPGNFPFTRDGVTYNWGTIGNVYDVNNNLLGKDASDKIVIGPEYEDIGTLRTVFPMYTTVHLEPNDFEWTHPPVSKGPFNITAEEWNDFVCYCTCKASMHPNEYYLYIDGCKSCIKLGNILTAENFNNLKNMLNMTNIPDVHKGDIIYASYLNDMLAKARSL